MSSEHDRQMLEPQDSPLITMGSSCTPRSATSSSSGDVKSLTTSAQVQEVSKMMPGTDYIPGEILGNLTSSGAARAHVGEYGTGGTSGRRCLYLPTPSRPMWINMSHCHWGAANEEKDINQIGTRQARGKSCISCYSRCEKGKRYDIVFRREMMSAVLLEGESSEGESSDDERCPFEF